MGSLLSLFRSGKDIIDNPPQSLYDLEAEDIDGN